jgi:signal peptidase I
MTSDYVVVNAAGETMPNARVAGLMAAVLTTGAPFRFTASGFSMSPFIHDGDAITIAPTPARIRYGDVVAFVNPFGGKLIVHRVVHISRDAYLMQGDHALKPDGCVSRADIIGRVIRVERHGKRVRLGLGIERAVIAFLSRRGWLVPMIVSTWWIFRPILKKFNP